MAIDFPNAPSPGATFTANSKTWTFTDNKWRLNVSVGGVQGPAGVAIQETAPATTDILWVDTSDTGLVIVPAGGTTGQVLAKSSSTSYDTAWATPVTSGDMALKADLASPTFTGTPTLPTGTIATTQTAGNSSTAIATTAFVGTAVANLVDSAPATLNTLDELALALGDDANFATTTATAIGLKAPLASPALTGTPTSPTAPTGTNTTQIATTAFVTEAIPVGVINPYGGSAAPTGWLLCYGQAVSRTTYAALFAVLSTTYNTGVVAGTDFCLPDLRGRTVAGIDNMGGTDALRLDIANSSGTVVGSQYVTLTSANLPTHQHAIDHDHGAFNTTGGEGNHTHYTQGGAFSGSTPYLSGWNTDGAMRESSTAGAHNHSIDVPNFTGSSGNGGFANTAVNNMQPTMVLNYIIKAL